MTLAERHTPAAPDTGTLGAAGEDYLLAIAALREGGGVATGSHVAHLLGVSEPSVTQMMRRLLEKGMVARHRPGVAGISLAPAGAAAGTWLLLRRRVCETFFVDSIGLPWRKALEAADRMEHALTPDGLRRLHRAIGSPTTCPHGNSLHFDDGDDDGPAGGEPARTEAHVRPQGRWDGAVTLSALAPGTSGEVEHLAGGIEFDAASIAYLHRHGITPGQTVVVVDADPLAGALTVRCGTKRFALSAALGAQVVVRPLPVAPRPRRAERRTAPAQQGPLPPPCRPEGAVRITAVRVEGPCQSGHAVGDQFTLGPQTPGGLCSATCAALLPLMQQSIAPANPRSPSVPLQPFERRCPGDGYVIWRVQPALAAQPGA